MYGAAQLWLWAHCSHCLRVGAAQSSRAALRLPSTEACDSWHSHHRRTQGTSRAGNWRGSKCIGGSHPPPWHMWFPAATQVLPRPGPCEFQDTVC